jgi:hypothetical protein
MSREGTEIRPRRSLVIVHRLCRVALALLNLLLHGCQQMVCVVVCVWLLRTRAFMVP